MDQHNFFSGNNAAFLEELYLAYQQDPSSVDPSWAAIFANLGSAPRSGTFVTDTPQQSRAQESVGRLVDAYRTYGHLRATLDPLGLTAPAEVPVLSLAWHGLSDADLDVSFETRGVLSSPTAPLRAILEKLQRVYCGTVGVEYSQLPEGEEKRWLQQAIEHTLPNKKLGAEEQRQILRSLSYAEGFEEFLHKKYVGAKRFSLLGEETLIPVLDSLLEEGAAHGVKHIIIGMAHRGRLNVLANTLGKPFQSMFSEFEKNPDPHAMLGSGDVKYHMGFSSDHKTRSGKVVQLSLCFNPSHLEAIDPVALGRVRAKQDIHCDESRSQGMALLIHGDAAFAGQGLVPETLNFMALEGYQTGGTVHLVLNNQVGFTTFPGDSRSTHYATDVALMLRVPIFHVNADDPEAAVAIMQLAMQYRQRFQKSVVIDLIGYRKYGHNESDEPTFTQPQMYRVIQSHTSVRRTYAAQLAAQGSVSSEESSAMYQRCMDEFQAALDEARAHPKAKVISSLAGRWEGYHGGLDKDVPEVVTGLSQERAKQLLERLAALPQGFHLHSKLTRFQEGRALMAKGERPLDWAAGEALAMASLLAQGHAVRLSGQDCRRGTFSQRHAAFSDTETGVRYVPMNAVSEGQANAEILDSPLSEAGVLGFEFGYSLDAPDRLVVWEAQFGDFVNNAQVVLDQFLSSAEDKWKRLSGLVLMLPHGYEGQGPEHSSARLERFLQLCAEDNLQVIVPTTPAQMFHALRRQVLRTYRKPLVVFTPKSLLRQAEAVSSLDDIAANGFSRVIADSHSTSGVKRLLLCSGKIFYDLEAERKKRGVEDVGIVRVEQLYPFPEVQLREQLAQYTSLSSLYWVQEEPENMGAWTFVAPRLQPLCGLAPRYVGRAASASPATGSLDAHVIEQNMILSAAFAE